MKKCKRCEIEKPLEEFYKHKLMPDGYLNFCKTCKKEESINNYNKNILNPEFLLKEKERGVEKYKRLSHNWKKPTKEIRKNRTNNYKKNYPEKYKCSIICSNLEKEEGFNLHHWSYNEEHYLDFIKVTTEFHYIIHRNIIYDQEHMMYRTLNNELLDSKEKHLDYISKL